MRQPTRRTLSSLQLDPNVIHVPYNHSFQLSKSVAFSEFKAQAAALSTVSEHPRRNI